MTIVVRPLTQTLGAEIANIDLSHDPAPEEIQAIAAAWARYGVLVFREQHISDAQQARFARRFGRLAAFGPMAGVDPDVKEVYRASNTDACDRLITADHELAGQLRINWFWHADGCYRAMPNRGVVLRGIEIIEGEGDTVFANMEAAYAALPSVTRHRVDRLWVCHSFAHMLAHCGLPDLNPQELARLPPMHHPLVWQHGDGRRSLFLSPPYMERIIGLTVHESPALVDELTEWATQERFLYRHQWHRHDILMWDNRWTMHKVTPYELTVHRRVMQGATFLGDDRVMPVNSE